MWSMPSLVQGQPGPFDVPKTPSRLDYVPTIPLSVLALGLREPFLYITANSRAILKGLPPVARCICVHGLSTPREV